MLTRFNQQDADITVFCESPSHSTPGRATTGDDVVLVSAVSTERSTDSVCDNTDILCHPEGYQSGKGQALASRDERRLEIERSNVFDIVPLDESSGIINSTTTRFPRYTEVIQRIERRMRQVRRYKESGRGVPYHVIYGGETHVL